MDIEHETIREAEIILSTKEPGDHSLADTEGILKKDNPRSLMNIAPQGVSELLEKMDPKLLQLSERELKLRVPEDPQLNRLRIAFWKEYDNAQSQMRGMLWNNISRFLQLRPVSYTKYFHNPQTMAYILCPPASYDVFLEESLSHGMTRIREILDLPLRDEDGKVNPKVGELILKAAAFLDLRAHGGFLQKSVHAEVGMSVGGMKKLANELSLEEIDKKIKELEGAGVTIDVTPK